MATAVPVEDVKDPRKKGLFGLIADVPALVGQLIRGEIEQIKKELIGKLTELGIGAGLFAGAALFGFFALAVLITTAILGLAVVLPAWLSALIVAVLLLIIAGVLAFIGLRRVKKGVPPVPQESLESVKTDVRAIKGMGNYDR
jgi:hypothetical protein